MIARRLPGALFGLWLAVAVLGAVLSVRRGHALEAGLGLLPAGFAGVGALLAARRPLNPLGWILMATALGFAVTITLEAYIRVGDDPALVALWLDDWLFFLWVALAIFWLPLLFPDGRLPSRGWRPVAWLGMSVFVLQALGAALGDRRLDTAATLDPINPYALPGIAGDAAAFVASIAGILYFLPALAAVTGLAVRTRRSRGVEREQLKWLAYVVAVMFATLTVASMSRLAPERLGNPVGMIGWFGFLALVMLGVPLAMGMAILRHRLYDIDVVINRTLVYAALTATLAATYLAVVLLLGLTVGESDLATAASTLAVAALFRPARARIQAGVDRRFYRRRYDAGRTLEAFSGRLRDQLDLEALGTEIRGVVRETVQPTHVSLWLRNPR